MNYLEHINTFEKGMNQDVSKKLASKNSYLKAVNAALRTNGDFYSLKNLKGTNLQSIILDNTNTFIILNILDSNYYIKETNKEERCITIFSAIKDSSNIYKFIIYVFRPSNGTIYNIYSKEVDDDRYFNTTVDYDIISDNGIDTIYYTNNIDPPGRLRCILGDTLTDRDIELQRRYPSGNIDISNIIYTPTTPPVVSDTHTLSLQNEAHGVGSEFESYSYDLLLDYDTNAGDSFEFNVSWNLNGFVRYDNPSSPFGSAEIQLSVKFTNPSGVDVINEYYVRSIDTSDTSDKSVNVSGAGNYTGLQLYNDSPYIVTIRVGVYKDGNDVLARGIAAFSINTISRISGDDSYRIGSPYITQIDSLAWQ